MMISISPFPILLAASLAFIVHAQDKPSFDIKNLPFKSEPGQYGSNDCRKWKPSSSTSDCQNTFINNVHDFCLWAPHNPATIGESEREVVSWCTKSGYGTRVIPDGTLTGAHFLKTPDFVQITGYGNFESMNIVAKDDGGELDAHGADGYGNPLGGLVWSRNVMGQEGTWVQIKEWSNFQSVDEFSFRACYGPNATNFCPHTLDEMGSKFNHPGNYDVGYYSQCESESGKWPAWFHGKEYHQGDPNPPAYGHKAPPTRNCKYFQSLKMGRTARVIPYRRSFFEDFDASEI